jgi:hypothetical protein
MPTSPKGGRCPFHLDRSTTFETPAGTALRTSYSDHESTSISESCEWTLQARPADG